MSGIAEILLDQGFNITGSDKTKTSVTERLEMLGATIFEGHRAKNIPSDTDILVYSSAVPIDNPEVKEAEKRAIPVVRRAEMLAEVMRLKFGIGIAGTHGKTTTTSMVSSVLIEGDLDPTVIVGGKLSALGGTNARLGQGEFIVVEADEYDRSFLALMPTIVVLTTMEEDHMDIYKDFEDIRSAFAQFANKVPFYGFIVICADEVSLRSIIPEMKKKKMVTYGIKHQADLMAKNLRYRQNLSIFDLIYKNKNLGEIKIKVPGRHNISNSLAAIAVGLGLDIPMDKIKKGIENFTGVYRRWEMKGERNGVVVYDDYAHHPTECAASIEGAKGGWKNRVICVFQPHLYSRTKDLYKEFANSLISADILIITDVYPARETPIRGISGELIAKEAIRLGHKETFYLKNKEKVPDFLNRIAIRGDMVVTMGAGDIYKYGEEFLGLKK